jgi:phosphoribosyl-ATP pyrophosphohydrolase/phosphoribosyl-AMP cyclohydrolase
MNLGYSKYADGLIPSIVKDWITGDVLMLGFMNAEAIKQTRETGFVTFFSRSKNRLWQKGESSGNTLACVEIREDCDSDSLLILAKATGPTCHKGTQSCFAEKPQSFISSLEETIAKRRNEKPDGSYVASLFSKGIDKIAQKVGEEAVEVVIEAKNADDAAFLNESADLLFHYLLLLNAKGKSLKDVIDILEKRKN